MKYKKFNYKPILVGVTFLLTMVLLILTINSTQTILHEETHKAIFSQHGCESKISYGFLYQSGKTEEISCIDNSREKEIRGILNSENEIVSYNVNILMTLLSIIATCLIWLTSLLIFMLTIKYRKKSNKYG